MANHTRPDASQQARNEKIACELVDEFRRSLSAEKWTNRNLQGLAVALAHALREAYEKGRDDARHTHLDPLGH